MIIWDFSALSALSLTLVLLLVLGYWVVYTYLSRQKQPLKQAAYFKHCVFCGLFFFNYKEEQKTIRCPRCESFLDR